MATQPFIPDTEDLLTPREALAFIAHMIHQPTVLQQPIALKGPPGIGKSAIWREAAESQGFRLWDHSRPAYMDSTDVSALLPDGKGGMRYVRPDFFPPADAVPTVLLLDELDKAKPDVQNALLQLFLDKQLHRHRVGDHVYIGAAMNRSQDRSHSQRMSKALNRRMIILNLAVDLPGWFAWAAGVGIEPAVIAYNQWRPEAHHEFDAESDEPSFPSPATWHDVSRLMQTGMDCESRMFSAAVRAKVGRARGTEFLGFLKVRKHLPTMASVVQNPTGAILPSEPSAQICIASTCAQRATPQTFGAIMTYCSRLGPALQHFMISLASSRADREYAAAQKAGKEYAHIKETAAYTNWAATTGEALLFG